MIHRDTCQPESDTSQFDPLDVVRDESLRHIVGECDTWRNRGSVDHPDMAYLWPRRDVPQIINMRVFISFGRFWHIRLEMLPGNHFCGIIPEGLYGCTKDMGLTYEIVEVSITPLLCNYYV